MKVCQIPLLPLMKTDINKSFSRAYKKICSGSSMVKEARGHGHTFRYSERHLQCVWADALHRPKDLRSSDGEKIIVDNPGRWNFEAGPDFLDATLTIGTERRRVNGDIEVHISPNDWKKHSHETDPRYKRVTAHVTYFDGTVPLKQLPRGTTQISMQNALESDPLFSFDNIDVTAYPYVITTAETPCGHELASWSHNARMSLLESAGEERMALKAERMVEAIAAQGREQVLYEEIMCALGYKHNKAPFRQIARRLPCVDLRSYCKGNIEKAYALLLGLSGLLPTRIRSQWDKETRVFIRHTWDNWWKMQAVFEDIVIPKTDWHLSGLRPQNHPVRRLAAAAALFGGKTDLHTRVTSLKTSDAGKWIRTMESFLRRSCRMPYWNNRLSFSGKLQESSICLLGAHRISAIISNVIIPYLAASGFNVKHLTTALSSEQENRVTRHTAFALFGRDHNNALLTSGLRQQGLLGIFYNFCITGRGCTACYFTRALTECKQHFHSAVLNNKRVRE